jgi:polysaccharide export outer membrane protein
MTSMSSRGSVGSRARYHFRLRWRALACAAALALSACGTARSTYDFSKEPDPRRDEFVIGPADELRVEVWKNAELSADVIVRPDGTITLPLVGDLRVGGSVPSQIRREVSQRLAAFFKGETVSPVQVSVRAINSYKFIVNGNVERPGVVSSRSYVTVLEALVLAGGLNRYADPTRITLLRKAAGGNVRTIPINYETLKTGEEPQQDIVLLAGDVLFVP